MGDLIGILSTVILVSTVCTLIFAVGAYVAARRHRDSVNTHEDGTEDLEAELDPQSASASPPPQETPLFRRAPARSGTPPPTDNEPISEPVDDGYVWK